MPFLRGLRSILPGVNETIEGTRITRHLHILSGGVSRNGLLSAVMNAVCLGGVGVVLELGWVCWGGSLIWLVLV